MKEYPYDTRTAKITRKSDSQPTRRYLIDAKRIRLRADYNTELDISESDVEKIINQGEEMLNFALGNIDLLPPDFP